MYPGIHCTLNDACAETWPIENVEMSLLELESRKRKCYAIGYQIENFWSFEIFLLNSQSCNVDSVLKFIAVTGNL